MMTNRLGENILFLGDQESPLLTWLRSTGESVIQTSDRIKSEFIASNNVGFLISYGYRHILRTPVLEQLPDRAINLHISHLPWNRGADPNLWSFLEGTPKGVTIHYLDEGVDTGDIIIQREVEFESDQETLATTYEKLHASIQELFKDNWADIRSRACQRHKQVGKGTIHKMKDKLPFSHLLTDGWNTRVSVLERHAKETQISKQFLETHDTEVEKDGNQRKA